MTHPPLLLSQAGEPAGNPWTALDEAGSGLTVDAFLTTLMSQVGNALRRTITVPYADAAELTVSEWRLLALIAHAGELPFSALVVQSTSDKALVSRTLRLLEERGLVALQAQGSTPRKKILCAITPAGRHLHDEVMPVARRHQAAALRVLTQEEREVMYRALLKLRGYCQSSQSIQASQPTPGLATAADGED
jgi:DNA-binding MarR family transcriptional regulator